MAGRDKRGVMPIFWPWGCAAKVLDGGRATIRLPGGAMARRIIILLAAEEFEAAKQKLLG